MSFLREACAANEVLHRKILSLLNADRKANNYLESSIVLPDTLSNLILTPTTISGQIFGAYQILKELGRGGMGAVYLAERADGEFEKKVAVKIIKRDLNSDFNLLRFRRERQILAEFDHPNIAKLLDGGTTIEGVPYLIMEFIKGESLINYCVKNNFNIEKRLKIFREVCSAVSYAHQRKIIHRDIKPSNILVTEQGTPKLLDFGIAKILDPDIIAEPVKPTDTFFQQLTPEYASPEQVKNEEITEASDVYSLGILLYELLTGERPYNFASRSPYEIARVICEQQAPSIRSKIINSGNEINSDLEKIVSTSLQKNPQHRYSSVEKLSRAIDNFLLGETIPADIIFDNFFERNLSSENINQSTSIAVAPLKFLQFENSENAENSEEEFLGVGLSDSLTTLLSNVQEIIVRPTSSVLWYAKQQNDPFLLGQKLNVDFVLEGRITRVNTQIRVTIQMLRISDNDVVWTSQFNENETDIFRLQDLIAEKTVASLKPHLTTGGKISLNSNRNKNRLTTDSKAYEAYLRGKYYWNTYTVEGIINSEKYFKEAIAYDSNFALAYAGLADFYNWRGVAEFSPPADSFPAAKMRR